MTRIFTCHCEVVLSADYTESLIAPVQRHFGESHPEFELTVSNVRNYLESEDRSTGPTERLEEIGDVEIRPIGTDSGPDAIRFFDIDAFPDNHAWGACYCMFYPRGGRANADWGEEPWQENRSDQLDRIAEGRTTGMLAYSGERVVGWCNATARNEFPGHATGEDQGVASVVCFAVAPPYRGHGIARRLLDGVVSTYRDRGFGWLEGYPLEDPGDQRAAYHGSLDLFVGAGFEVTSDDPLVVRRVLP